MKWLNRTFFATVTIASFVHLTLAYGQNEAKTASETAGGSCPAPAEMTALHLYGEWQASWDGLTGSATVDFGRNPNHPDGVRGTVRREGGLMPAEALVAGDVDNGVFMLDESTDGKAITAVWSGEVVAGSCGREISGLWIRSADRSEHRFVLRKRPGWK